MLMKPKEIGSQKKDIKNLLNDGEGFYSIN